MTPLVPAYKIERDSEHVYWLDGRAMPGVTTILEARGKPWLAAWKVADLCAALGVKKDGKAGWKKPTYTGGLWEVGKGYSAPEIAAAVNAARMGSTKKSDAAKATGTDAHAWIEAAISADVMGAPAPKMPDDPEAACAAAAWWAWRQAHEVKWLASESVVGSKEYWYAGTFDARAIVDGVPCLIDWKTSASIYDEYWIQMSAYVHAYREMSGDESAWRRVGARVPKDGKALEWVECPPWATQEICFSAFIGALHNHRFNQLSDAAREGY